MRIISILITMAILILLFNRFGNINSKGSIRRDQKIKNEANQVVEQTQKQLDYARSLQKEEQQKLSKE